MRCDVYWISIAIIDAVLAIAPNSSCAIESDSSHVIKGRIYNFRVIATSYKQINEELESRKPNVEKIEGAAREIVLTGEGMTNWFPRKPKTDGFGIALDEKTYAKLKIWEHPDEFERLYSLFHEEARRMRIVAVGGDEDIRKS